MEYPGAIAAGVVGGRLKGTMYPNQIAELPRGVNRILPRGAVTWITTDRKLMPNQSGGAPPSPQGSEVLANQAAMTAAMMGKLGGP